MGWSTRQLRKKNLAPYVWMLVIILVATAGVQSRAPPPAPPPSDPPDDPNGGGNTPPPPGPPPAPLAMVSGSNIVDQHGSTIQLQGIHVPIYMAEKVLMPVQFEQLANIGFNTLEIGMYWGSTRNTPSERSELEPGVYTETGLEIMKENIRRAGAAGLMVILQVRVCSDPLLQSSVSQHGWATSDDLVFNRVDKSGTLSRDRFANYLEWLTVEILPMPSVIAIEPWHFPYHKEGDKIGVNTGKYDQERLDLFFGELTPLMISSVRKHSEKMIILDAPVLGHFNYSHHPGPYSEANLVYATGGYGSHAVAYQNNIFVSWSGGPILHPDPSYKQFQELYGVPVVDTEGPGIRQGSWADESRIPEDRFTMFTEVLWDVDANTDGWIIHAYGAQKASDWRDRVAWGILLSDQYDDPESSEGRMVEIIREVIARG